ncbi:MAG: glycosyltransferase family 2 protein, partial [Deltaproteobacteria bacterium]
MKTAFIIATKNRPRELRRMLQSLEDQSRRPDRIIIVDGSSESAADPGTEYPGLSIDCIRCIPPSASRQRNVGLQRIPSDTDFVGFLDDDIILKPGAIEAMARFWDGASEKIAGAAFNMINHPALAAAGIKTSALAERLGVYSSRKGAVLPSGFQTMIGIVDEDQEVDWIPTTAAVWRREFVGPDSFDEWFSGYSYLEDLEFSYRIRKNHRLAVISGARYEHWPAHSGR